MIKVITDNNDLKHFCDTLKNERFITVDTEFIREKTYYPQVCLIQVAGEISAAAIDPLAKGMDLKPLYDLLLDTNILKVFHACRQDIEIFYQATGKIPTPLFDTQIAAMVCGYGESVSYETLVNKILSASVDKSSRFTDWARRPLTEKQLAYAMDDVLHLRQIYIVLEKELKKRERESWIQDEMQPLLDVATYENDPRDAWKRLRLRNASPRYLAYVQAVAYWREITARERNVPRSRVMKDEVVPEVANVKPKDFNTLQSIRGFHPTMPANSYNDLFEIITETESMPASEYPCLPPRPVTNNNSEALADLLRLLLKACARENNTVPRIIADKEEIELLSEGKREGIKALHGWRYQVFGEKALKLIEGKIAIKADPRNGTTFIELE